MRTGFFAWAAMFLAACGSDDEAAKAAAGRRPTPAVVVAKITAQDVPVVREFVARTQAVRTVTIQARVEAILEKRMFEEGHRIKKGQVLYELDKLSLIHI